jgi:hypothetical protein
VLAVVLRLAASSQSMIDGLFRQSKGGRLKLESKKPVVLVLGTGWGAHSLVKVCWCACECSDVGMLMCVANRQDSGMQWHAKDAHFAP